MSVERDTINKMRDAWGYLHDVCSESPECKDCPLARPEYDVQGRLSYGCVMEKLQEALDAAEYSDEDGEAE